MKLIPSQEMKIDLLPGQEEHLCTKETIREIFAKDEKGECLAFDIFEEDRLIGFAMFCQQLPGLFFLWNYAIDAKHQNQGLGTRALREVLDHMLAHYDVKAFTTTYTWGNEEARKLYEKVGFIETDVVEEEDYKEVNMIYGVNPHGLYELAMQFVYGDGVPEDNEEAAYLLADAHLLGCVEASYNLGICYHYGHGVEADLKKAFELYLAAAEKGYGKGMELVGRFYNQGIFVSQDRSQAEYWLEKAMKSGDAEAAAEAEKEWQRGIPSL